MDYEQICKYIFEKEKVDWNLHDSKKRNRELVVARQISIYIGNWFYPGNTWFFLGSIFKKDHATAIHSYKSVRNLMFADRKFRIKVYDYLEHFTNIFKEEQKNSIVEVVKEESAVVKLLEVINKMELVATVYCEITGKKIIEK